MNPGRFMTYTRASFSHAPDCSVIVRAHAPVAMWVQIPKAIRAWVKVAGDALAALVRAKDALPTGKVRERAEERVPEVEKHSAWPRRKPRAGWAAISAPASSHPR